MASQLFLFMVECHRKPCSNQYSRAEQAGSIFYRIFPRIFQPEIHMHSYTQKSCVQFFAYASVTRQEYARYISIFACQSILSCSTRICYLFSYSSRLPQQNINSAFFYSEHACTHICTHSYNHLFFVPHIDILYLFDVSFIHMLLDYKNIPHILQDSCVLKMRAHTQQFYDILFIVFAIYQPLNPSYEIHIIFYIKYIAKVI